MNILDRPFYSIELDDINRPISCICSKVTMERTYATACVDDI
jgi:hypothetical protein